MNLSIPIYVVRCSKKNESDWHEASTLFGPNYYARHHSYAGVMDRLRRDLYKAYTRQAQDISHKPLHLATFAPILKSQNLSMRLELKMGSLQFNPLVVQFQHLGNQIALLPIFPDFWFVVPEDGDLESAAVRALTAYLRGREKEGSVWDLDQLKPAGKEWIKLLDLTVVSARQKQAEAKDHRISLNNDRVGSGAEELNKVGTCLSWDKQALPRPYCHPQALDKLQQFCAVKNHTPLLIIGPTGVGKSQLVRQWVVERPPANDRSKQQVWHLAPQRLISGMSYVGQWEKRLLSIVKHMQKHQHTYVCDDLPGMFRAGLAAQSDLNVALVLKTFLEERSLSFIAEITPSQWQKLQEWDRGFCELFQIVRLEEPEPRRTFSILLSSMRELEFQNKVIFQPGILRHVMRLTDRFESWRAAPGRGMNLLELIAQKHAGKTVGETQATLCFQAKSGLTPAFVDQAMSMTRASIEEALGRAVKGQEQAVGAVTDIILRAKARVNDPDKPFGSLLFLGPTGVGKTQLAKATAAFLYGDETRLLRFDMNEFNNGDAASRLVGDFYHPNGLLTQAVRQNPFSVVLFDEIEKADPSVYDLLLQVLGEARLTDAAGFTVDFRNTILILTSNLGAREASGSLGFGEQRGLAAVYRGAARQFFRPEFYNRLDAVVPFQALQRKHMRNIAELQVERLLQRDGFRRRRCFLTLSSSFLDELAREGYHPSLGARALKRTIERKLAVPLGRVLSNTTPGEPLVLRISAGSNPTSSLQSLSLKACPRRVHPFDPNAELDQDAALRDLETLATRIDALEPADGYSFGDDNPDALLYFSLRELLAECRLRFDEVVGLEADLREPTSSPRRAHLTRPIPLDDFQIVLLPPDLQISELFTARDCAGLMRTWMDSYRTIGDPVQYRRRAGRRRLLETIALLKCLLALPRQPEHERCLILSTPLARAGKHAISSFGFGDVRAYDELPGLHFRDLPESEHSNLTGYLLAGPHAQHWAPLRDGIHVRFGPQGETYEIIRAVPVPPEIKDVDAWFKETWFCNHETLLDRLLPTTENPASATPMLVRYHSSNLALDGTTGLMTAQINTGKSFELRVLKLAMIGRIQGVSP